MKRPTRLARRRGATITIVALSLAAILAMGAITVDLGMLFKLRNDAQRTADAAALAGASAFIDQPALSAQQMASDRAFDYVARNYIGGHGIDTAGKSLTIDGNKWTVLSNNAKVEIAPDLYRVRVTVWRPSAPSWFGKILGVTGTKIQAYAAAMATEAGGAKCVKPFALADAWDDANEDANGDDWWASPEEWTYNPADGDFYAPWDGIQSEPSGGLETGYGSIFRNPSGFTRDYGREMIIKPQGPADEQIHPGQFFAWEMPDDTTNTSTCGIGNGGGNAGAQDYSQNICSCNNTTVYADGETKYDIKTGNMEGPTRFGIQDLIDLDPNAEWDPDAMDGAYRGKVINSDWSNWRDSPRVIKVALYDPAELYKSGKIQISFNNIALLFVKEYNFKDDAVIAHFITFAEGSGSPGPGGPLARVLRLVE